MDYDDEVFNTGSTEAEEPRPEPDEPSPGRWTLGDHTMDTGIDVEDLISGADRADGVNDDVADALQSAAEMVESTEVSGFECPVCGLNHGHADHKHDVRSDGEIGFNVSDEFADEVMQYVPYCHCGANECAMLVDYWHFISVPMFDDQHEFEAVLELPYETVRAVQRALIEVDVEQANEEADLGIDRRAHSSLHFDEALAYVEATEDLVVDTAVEPELEAFLNRVKEVKSGANAAPISRQTREAIAANREGIEELLEEADEADAEDYDATGVVDFFNATGAYGFIESDQIEHDVFFHMDDLDSPDPTEGVEVAFNVEYAAKGPRATALHILDDQ